MPVDITHILRRNSLSRKQGREDHNPWFGTSQVDAHACSRPTWQFKHPNARSLRTWRMVVDEDAGLECEHTAACVVLPVVQRARVHWEIPHPGGVVRARGDHARAIGTERRREDRILMREGLG